MAILDLSLVTRAYINLIKAKIEAPSIWPKTPVPSVTSQPPDELSDNVIAFYLYHISEDSQYKNLPPPGNDYPPVRHIPMSLNLFYQLTAHSKTESLDGTYDEQRMLGIAMKALHDYPIINEATKIENTEIFPVDLKGKGNLLKIILQPVEPRDAVSYWTAGSKPMRLAAYYQVSVVLLEPEESKSRAGKVLSYGLNTFVGMGPRIDSCSNKLSYKLPENPETEVIELRPAQVPFGGEVIFHGSGFGDTKTELLFRNALWGNFYGYGTNWGLKVTDNRANLTIQENTTIYDEKGNTKNVKVIPGIYSAKARVKKKISLSDGSWKEVEYFSNECPFAITPYLDISDNNIQKHKGETVEVAGKLFSNKMQLDPNSPDLTEVISVQVYVGQDKYQEGAGSGSFEVEEKKITIHLKNNMGKGNYQLRVFANGVESFPNWITII